jgi:TRAP-type transport system periplasmic protein
MKRIVAPLAVIAASAALVMSSPLRAEEISVRAIGFLPKNHPVMAQAQPWVDGINGALKGKLNVKYVGGPEVIPALQQAEAATKGVIDIVMVPTAFYQSQLPEASAFSLSRKTVEEERQPGGLYDVMVKRHEALNLHYIGRVHYGNFYLWTKDKVAGIDGLKGVKLRTTALYDRFMRRIGAIPVTVPEGETYTALEGGTVGGMGWPVSGPRERGWTKIVKNVIDLPFYSASNVLILMNQEKWKTLPPDVQAKVIEMTALFEPKMVKHFKDAENVEWAELQKVGVSRIKFSDAENKKYLDAAYDVEWENLVTKVPERVTELRRLTGN